MGGHVGMPSSIQKGLLRYQIQVVSTCSYFCWKRASKIFAAYLIVARNNAKCSRGTAVSKRAKLHFTVQIAVKVPLSKNQ